jgi:uncharacterized membrane protein
MRFVLTASLVLALVLIGSRFVFAQSTQQYYGGPGGEITGRVIGVNGQPFDWATIYASSSQQTFEAFSGMSGVYQMRVPSGTYKVSVSVQGYTANSATVNVTDNSSNTVNFYLQLAVPEFPPTIEPLLIAFTVAVVFFIFKKTYSKSMPTI